MEKIEQDVMAESSAAVEEQVVNEVASDQATDTSNVNETESAASSQQTNETVPQSDEVDERGIPYKNRFMEYKRKYEDVATKLDTVLTKVDALSQKEQPKKYTEDQLRDFIAATDNPYHKTWAVKELDALRDEKTAGIVRGEIEKIQRVQEDRMVRQQVAQEVLGRYSDATVKDAQGRPVSFNPDHPLTQRINMYLQDPELANNPRGLMVAAALAYSDVGMNQSGKTQTKLQQMKRENKVLASKTLTEGTGTQKVVSKTPLQASVEQARSGSFNDARNAMKNILVARGSLKSEE